MNLFCFTLEGSSESIYEPACSQTLTDILPKYQCSSAYLARKPQCGGSDPSLCLDQTQNGLKLKQTGRWLCVPASSLEKETSDKLISQACCVSSAGRKDLSYQKKAQNRDTCKASCHNSKLARGRRTELNRDRTDTDLPAQLPRFGRFDVFRHQPLVMKPQDYGNCLHEREQDDGPREQPGEAAALSDGENSGVAPEESPPDIADGKKQMLEPSRKVTHVGGGRPLTTGCRRFSNSLESLNSGQSSSSGVASGSDLASNPGSLGLEDDMRQFCGRARVHTGHVPSPYDTDSLQLTVGDVIDIISKPPMGIWTGMLNGRVGNFKFIYVDVLTEESPEPHSPRARHKSTVQEVLKRLSMEEYASSLQLNGYQTVDDLTSLEERHLAALSMTDPEHRHRLLAAVDCLRQLRPESQAENEVSQEAKTPSENMKAHMNNYPGDPCRHVSPDGPGDGTGHMHLHCPP